MSLSNYQRILRVMKWNYNRGICKESVVDVYRTIIKQKVNSGKNLTNNNN